MFGRDVACVSTAPHSGDVPPEGRIHVVDEQVFVSVPVPRKFRKWKDGLAGRVLRRRTGCVCAENDAQDSDHPFLNVEGAGEILDLILRAKCRHIELIGMSVCPQEPFRIERIKCWPPDIDPVVDGRIR